MVINFFCERANIGDSAKISRIIQENLRNVNSKFHSEFVIEHSIKYTSLENIEKSFSWKDVFIVRNKDGEITGVGMLANFGNENEEKWSVSNLFVDEKYKGLGIGTLLLQQIENELINKGKNKLFVPSSRNAISFYEKKGFQKVQEEDEEELTWMMKIL